MPTIYMPTAASGNDAERARLMREYLRLHDERESLQAEIEHIETKMVEVKRRMDRIAQNATGTLL